MYCETAHKLVQHAKRTQALTGLPPYQTELVRNALREVRELDASINATLAPFQGSFNPADDQATACTLLVNHLSIRRNKRCLLAYHRVRTHRLEEVVWDGREETGLQTSTGQGVDGASAVGNGEGDGGASNLSPEEEEYVRQYGDLVAAVKGQWTDVDLTGSLEPPRELFIDVRVLKDAGEIQTEYGSINLTKHSQFYVRHGDVERLIAQGYLQRLD